MPEIKKQIEVSAVSLLKSSMDDYASRIWEDIKNDILDDVQECSEIAEGGGFTDGDVALALGRAISKRTGSLTPNEYQNLVMRMTKLPNEQDMLTHAVLGLTMETGAVARILGRTYQGYPVYPAFLKNKLGKCLQMIAKACTAVGLTLEDVMQDNITML